MNGAKTNDALQSILRFKISVILVSLAQSGRAMLRIAAIMVAAFLIAAIPVRAAPPAPSLEERAAAVLALLKCESSYADSILGQLARNDPLTAFDAHSRMAMIVDDSGSAHFAWKLTSYARTRHHDAIAPTFFMADGDYVVSIGYGFHAGPGLEEFERVSSIGFDDKTGSALFALKYKGKNQFALFEVGFEGSRFQLSVAMKETDRPDLSRFRAKPGWPAEWK